MQIEKSRRELIDESVYLQWENAELIDKNAVK